jgi:hypothetical protein
VYNVHCLQGCQRVYFQTKNPNLGKIWRAFKWKVLSYFITIWNILLPLGIPNLWPFLVILYIFPVLVCLDQEKSGNPDCLQDSFCQEKLVLTFLRFLMNESKRQTRSNECARPPKPKVLKYPIGITTAKKNPTVGHPERKSNYWKIRPDRNVPKVAPTCSSVHM